MDSSMSVDVAVPPEDLLESHSALEALLHLANSSEGLRWSDVTLLDAQGGRHQAHKIILASHSRFLHRVLQAHDMDRDPEDTVLTLADMDESVVTAALNFIYKGEVGESQSEVATLDEAREGLGLVGRDFTPLRQQVETIVVEADVTTTEMSVHSSRPKRKRTRNKRLDADAFELSALFPAAVPEKQKKTVHVVEEQEIKREPFFLEDYACCGAEFISRADLDSHKKSFGCEIDFAKHQTCTEEEDDEEEVEKVVVEKRRTRRATKTRIRKGVNKENLRCCDTEFENEVVYTSHKVVGHQEKPDGNQFLICCDEKLSGNLKVHLQSSHMLDDATEQAKCCDNTFEGLLDLTRHCASTHGLRLSQYKRMICCATTLSSFDEWTQHKEQDEDHIECNYCAFISKDQRHLSMHLYSKHKVGDPEEGKGALACKFCGQAFKSIGERQEHEDRHDDSFKYSCGSCSKEFKLMSSLKTHMYRLGKNHNPDAKEYNCDLCKEVFPTVNGRRKHLRQDHQKKENFNCDDCDQSFLDRHRLVTHNKVRHLKVKDIQCTYCGKLFATQERMRIHEKFVHVVENEKVPCDVCMKEFSNKDRMIDHRRSVHRDRKYQCESCGSTFKNSSTLKSHVVSIHLSHDKKPLRCEICGKGFLHDSRLRAHEIIHNDDNPFSCKFCGRPNKCKNNNLKHEKRCKKGSEDSTALIEESDVMETVMAEETIPLGTTIATVAIEEAEVLTA